MEQTLTWRLGLPKDRSLDKQYLCLTEKGRYVVLTAHYIADGDHVWWDYVNDSGRVVSWADLDEGKKT